MALFLFIYLLRIIFENVFKNVSTLFFFQCCPGYVDTDLCIPTTTLRKLAHAINRDFLALEIENIQLKNFDIFLIFAPKHRLWVLVRTASLRVYLFFLFLLQNIDCGYSLELPR